eukprot:1458283-Prymnesium_polylepis.1
MQTSLQQLHHVAAGGDHLQSSLLGLVCDVRLHRARYTLSVSSAVEVINSTAATVQLRPPLRVPDEQAKSNGAGRDLSETFITVASVKKSMPQSGPARGQPLPLSYTWPGSDDTCWGVAL